MVHINHLEYIDILSNMLNNGIQSYCLYVLYMIVHFQYQRNAMIAVMHLASLLV